MAKKISCPVWIDDEAKKEWKRIIKFIQEEGKEFTERDYKTLEVYCCNYSKFKKTEEILSEKGYTFETPNGYEQQRPEVSIGNKAQERMLACAKELGLTPASRARMSKNAAVSTEAPSEEETEMEGLMS